MTANQQSKGVLSLIVLPEQMAAALVNRDLEIKAPPCCNDECRVLSAQRFAVQRYLGGHTPMPGGQKFLQKNR